MLNKAKTLKGYKLNSRDGELGKVKEFYFDDHLWTIRYLVADTGDWLTERQVLISPYALGLINKKEKYITIELTKKQIEDSPSLDSDQPVSRQFEYLYYGYFGWPVYWSGPSTWGNYPSITREGEKRRNSNQGGKAWDANLRSTHDVDGHSIQAIDGEIGHVEDFIVADDSWAIRYLVVDTQNWWPGKKVLISPKWIERISWPESKVFINLSRESIKQSPEYTAESAPTHGPLTRDYELRLHQHYNRQGYWADEQTAKEQSR
jgi:uncharacterized protein YrrD